MKFIKHYFLSILCLLLLLQVKAQYKTVPVHRHCGIITGYSRTYDGLWFMDKHWIETQIDTSDFAARPKLFFLEGALISEKTLLSLNLRFKDEIQDSTYYTHKKHENSNEPDLISFFVSVKIPIRLNGKTLIPLDAENILKKINPSSIVSVTRKYSLIGKGYIDIRTQPDTEKETAKAFNIIPHQMCVFYNLGFAYGGPINYAVYKRPKKFDTIHIDKPYSTNIILEGLPITEQQLLSLNLKWKDATDSYCTYTSSDNSSGSGTLTLYIKTRIHIWYNGGWVRGKLELNRLLSSIDPSKITVLDRTKPLIGRGHIEIIKPLTLQ
ncbi:MAG TPA: hypothetical protein VK806_06410 [Bacteroidia bacterium]|nr:hypothetical protein [Bacteroidia bacterium]